MRQIATPGPENKAPEPSNLSEAAAVLRLLELILPQHRRLREDEAVLARQMLRPAAMASEGRS